MSSAFEEFKKTWERHLVDEHGKEFGLSTFYAMKANDWLEMWKVNLKARIDDLYEILEISCYTNDTESINELNELKEELKQLE